MAGKQSGVAGDRQVDWTDPATYAAVLKELSARDEDPDARRDVGDQLESHATASAPVARDLMSDPLPGVRAVAAWALGRIRNPLTIPALLEGARDSHARVRAASVQALGEFGRHEPVIDVILEALGDTAPFVRRAATLASSRVRQEDLLTPVLQVASDSDPEVRSGAAYALGVLVSVPGGTSLDRVVRQTLTRMCEDDEDLEVREAAEEALQRIEHSAV
jgi:hypothetical protein